MKKILLSLAAFALSLTAGAQVVYQTDFSTEEEFNKWTVIDANGDNTTWKFDADGSQSKVYYPYSSVNDADDWLISPELTATKTGKVMINYTVYGTLYGEKMEVYTGASTETYYMTKRATYDNIISERTTDYFLLDVTEGKKFRVAFRATSLADTWRFYMCEFLVKHVDKVVDLSVDNVLSPVSGSGLTDAETVKVNIVNNGSDASENFKVAYKVDGGEPVVENVAATLGSGESMEYTFATKVDLSTPRHKYTIKAYAIDDNDINNGNDTTTVAVRNSAPVTPPYKMGFETSEDTDDICYYNLNEDSGDWEVFTSMWMNMARTGYSCLAYNYDSNNDANDWAILAPIQVEAGSYVLRYWYSASEGHTEKFGVYWGNGNTPDDMTNKLEDIAATQGAYQESFKIVTFDKPQTIYLGFYCYSDKNENWLTIDDVQFYKASSDAVDLVASEISKPYDYVRTPNNSNVDFEVQNVGIADAEGKVIVYVDDVQKAEVALSMKAGEIKNLTANGVLDGLAEGTHTVKVTIESADDNEPSNNTIEKTITVLGTAYKYYDFEDGQLPADFTYYAQDGGTVNASAGEEFNEYGWGIFNIEKHETLGEYLLAGTSWIDGADKADRWVVLPRVNVTGDNAYLVWDANSYNPFHLETYRVKISDGSGDPADYWYTTEKEYGNESTTVKTRGLSLSKYSGKDIYIAFNLTTKIGDALCLDNIGIYGEVVDGVDSINSDNGIIFVGDNYIGAADAKSISVADPSGRVVASVAGNTLYTTDLQPGVYVGVVKFANGAVKTTKFVKK